MPYRRLSLAAVIGPVSLALAPMATPPAAAEQASAPITVAQSSLDDLEEMLREAEDRAQQLIERQSGNAEVERLQEELANTRARLEDTRARLEEMSGDLRASAARVQELQGQLDAARTQAGESDAVLAELAEARQELEELRDRLRAAPDADEVRALREELQAAQQQVEQLTAARAQAEARLREAQAGADAGSEATAPDAADPRVAQLGQELEAAWDWIEELNEALAEAQSGREAAEAELARAREAAAHENAGEADAAARIAELEVELDDVRTARSQAEEDLRRAREDAERRVDQLEIALAESTARAERMGEQYQALQSRVDQLNTVLAQVTGRRDGATAPGDGEARSEAELALARAPEVSPAPDRSGDGAAATTAALTTPRGDPGAAAGLRALTTRTVSAASARRYLADLGAEQRQAGLTITVPGDLFEVNSATINDEADRILWRVAAVLAYYGDQPVRIVGHTDSLGDPAYNRTLSERRAGAVRDYFVERFAIDLGRLTIEGLGEARPIASNDTPTGRQQNRRVEVVIQN